MGMQYSLRAGTESGRLLTGSDRLRSTLLIVQSMQESVHVQNAGLLCRPGAVCCGHG